MAGVLGGVTLPAGKRRMRGRFRMDRDDPAYKGQADYSRLVLDLYDPLVLGPIARYVWRCPTSELLARYRQHIRSRHLDIGPGTGYFLSRSNLPNGSRVTLVDPNSQRPRARGEATPGIRGRGRRGGCLQAAPGAWSLRLGRLAPRAPLSARAAGSQGQSGRPRRRHACARWRAIRRLGPRGVRTSHPTGTRDAPGV